MFKVGLLSEMILRAVETSNSPDDLTASLNFRLVVEMLNSKEFSPINTSSMEQIGPEIRAFIEEQSKAEVR